MGTIKSVDFERSGVGKGIKIAAFVLILTAAALVTDHMGIVENGTRQAVAQTKPVGAPVATTAAIDGFALPEHLKPTTADAGDPAPSF